jgi:hypothetical protein
MNFFNSVITLAARVPERKSTEVYENLIHGMLGQHKCMVSLRSSQKWFILVQVDLRSPKRSIYVICSLSSTGRVPRISHGEPLR